MGAATAAAQNRGQMRYTCRGEVTFRKDAQFSLPLKAKLRDIGGRGCFVMTKEKFPLNTRMVLELKIGMPVLADGVIGTLHKEAAVLTVRKNKVLADAVETALKVSRSPSSPPRASQPAP